MKFQFDTTLERDIDLLIMEEFVSDKDFAQLFLDAVGLNCDCIVKDVIHSKTDAALGESDVVIILEINGKRHAIHIEDTEDYNVASQKLCEKLGMRREGLFMEFVSFVKDEDGNPIYENTYQYAILKMEWEQNGK